MTREAQGSLGQEIRRKRRALGETQESLAFKLSVHRTTIGQWERDEVAPSPAHMRSLVSTGLLSAEEAIRLTRLEVETPSMQTSAETNYIDGDETGGVDLDRPIPGFDGRPAIAVLPFVNRGGRPDETYFSDGIAEDVIEGLARWRWFPVIGGSSTRPYRGRAVDVRQIGMELGARYLVEGSVRRKQNGVRISTRLIEAPSRRQLWGEHYDCDIEDIFDVQDDITAQVVAQSAPEIAHAEIARVMRTPRRRPNGVSSWEFLQQGLWHFNSVSETGNRRAREFFGRAADMDPGSPYPLAWEALTLVWDLVLGWADAPDDTLGRAIAAAETAVAMDEGEALSHAALSACLVLARQPVDAVRHARRAVRLNPSLSSARAALGYALIMEDKPEEALEETVVGIRLSPRDPFLWQFWAVRCLAYLFIGDYDQALSYARRSRSRESDQTRALLRLAAAEALSGNTAAAKETLLELDRIAPDLTTDGILRRFGFANQKHETLILDGLRRAGWHR